MVLQQVLGELGLSAASRAVFHGNKASKELVIVFFFKTHHFLKDPRMIEVGSQILAKPAGFFRCFLRPAHFVSGLGLGRRSFQTATLLSAGRGS